MRNWLIILFVFINYISFSQSNILIKKQEIDNLSSEKVNSIFIDNKTFSWISTPEGLNRFDGKNNNVFRSNPFDSTTLINNNVLGVFQIDNDGVFIKSIEGLDYFNYSNFNFKRIQDKSKPIHHIINENKLFFTTESEGLFQYDLNNNKLENFKFDPRNPLSISSSNFSETQNQIVNLIRKDNSSADLWIGTLYGLNKFNLNTKSSKRFYENSEDNSLNSNIINDIFDLADSTITLDSDLSRKLLISTDNGLSIVDKFDNKINNYESLKNNKIYNIFKISTFLLIHKEDGIYKIENLNEDKIKLRKVFNSTGEIVVKIINENEFIIYKKNRSKFNRIVYFNNQFIDIPIKLSNATKINDVDNFNNSYYVSSNSGLIKINEKLDNINNISLNEIGKNTIIGFAENDYYKAILLSDGNLLLYEYESLIKKIKIKGLKNEDILNTVIHLEEDEFIALGNNKLQIINLNDFSIETYQTSNEGFNSILDGNIDNLKTIKRQSLSSKELWISLNNGVSILNLNTKEFNNFKFNPRSKNKFPQGFTSVILSNENEIWLTNNSTGLYKYDEKNLDEINHYIFDINDKKSITSSTLTDIYEYDDKLYIASNGDGIYIYDNDSTGFLNLTIENGLLSNQVLSFFETYEYLFILTDLGLNYFDYDGNLRNLNDEDGLLIGNFLKNGLSLYNDFLYVYSDNQIQSIDINNIFVDNVKPIINITQSLMIDNNFDKRNYKINNNQIDLTYDISNIELVLSSPSYYKANNTSILYKLSPINEDWVSLGKERKLIIQSSNWSNSFINGNKILVPFGNYKLEIKSSNSSGIESSNILSYDLSVTPPWYLTQIAFFSYLIILGSSIYFYVKYNQGKTKRLMEEKRKEEELQEAHNLQMGLLAKENPNRDDLDISTYIRCATEVGGDYYDFIEFEDGSLLAICGDATGHGTASGMMVSITKAGLLGIDSNDPEFMLKTLNRIIKKVDIGRLRMSLNLVHFQNGSIKLSSAAMPPIYHFEKKNKKVDEIQLSNLPLGGLMNESFSVIDKKFVKDDVLVMMSDGLPEAPNKKGELLDYEAVKKCIEENSYKSANEIKNELVKLSETWLDGIHNPDDITIVVCKKKV
tara:strand:+ start:2390 stop:5704 length:3315 start_codon:yes stop_codon:yes gene_type:complete